MSSASIPPPTANGMTESGTIPQLISNLKSAFQLIEFDKAQQILTAREESMKREIVYWKNEFQSMEMKHATISLEKLMAEEELNQCKRERDLLKDQVARAGEDHRVQIARLEEDQRVRMARVEEDQKLSREREKNSVERYTKLWEDYTKIETEKKRMSFTISTLESEKNKALREVVACRKRFDEVNLRVSRLEEDVAMLSSGGGPMVEEKREEVVGELVVAGKEVSSSTKSRQEKADGTGPKNVGHPQVKESTSNCGEKASSLVGAVDSMEAGSNRQEEVRGSAPDSIEAGNNHRGGGSRVVIEINDSDDEMPTRKRGSCNDSYDDVKRNIKRQYLEELINNANLESSDSEPNSSSCSENAIENEIAMIKRSRV